MHIEQVSNSFPMKTGIGPGIWRITGKFKAVASLPESGPLDVAMTLDSHSVLTGSLVMPIASNHTGIGDPTDSVESESFVFASVIQVTSPELLINVYGTEGATLYGEYRIAADRISE